nr:hypothetical protein [Halolamina pelagica]
MSNVNRTELAAADSTTGDLLSLGVLGAAVLTFVGSWLLLLQWVDEAATVAGLPVLNLLGVGLVVIGGGLAFVGVGSRLDYVDTAPSSTAGVVVGAVFGLLWAILGGLVGTLALGDATVLWLPVAAVFGIGGFLGAVLPARTWGRRSPWRRFCCCSAGSSSPAGSAPAGRGRQRGPPRSSPAANSSRSWSCSAPSSVRGAPARPRRASAPKGARRARTTSSARSCSRCWPCSRC